MTREKIFATEMLSNRELDTIFGGNIFETRALARAVGVTVPLANGWGVNDEKYKKCIKELSLLLKQEFNIDATFDMIEKNAYSVTENSGKKSLTHIEVMKRVRSHYPQPAD